MIKGLNFQPWISKIYEAGGGKYGRLLLLGESHYYEEDNEEDQKDEDVEIETEHSVGNKNTENNFTSEVVQNFIDQKHNIPFFRNLGLLFNEKDRFEIWNQVAFANGIQVALNSPTAQPSANEISTIKNSFWLLLENLRPDKILICSKRMWDHWLPEDRAKHLLNVSENKKRSNIWKYQINNGHCLAMGINHPSKYFSYTNWRPIVINFLSNKYVNASILI